MFATKIYKNVCSQKINNINFATQNTHNQLFFIPNSQLQMPLDGPIFY